MKIAVINQYSSAGGGSRFTRSLVLGLANKYPKMEIGLFSDAATIKRDGLISLFSDFNNVKIYPLSQDGEITSLNFSVKKRQVRKSFLINIKNFVKKITLLKIIYRFLKFKIIKNENNWYKFKLTENTVDVLNAYDLIYLAWPYFIEPVNFKVPVVATFHDFNYKQNFGNFDPELLTTLEEQIPRWLKIVKIKVVSTEFISSELKKFYFGEEENIRTVFLAPFNVTKNKTDKIKLILEKLKLSFNKYLLSAANTSPHKNLSNLIDAYGLISKKVSRPLVLSGFGTDNIKLFLANRITREDPLYKDLKPISNVIKKHNLKLNKDIICLGYVSDKEIDALIKGASLVVSSSLYEAGSGPGLDAWNAQVPIAFSNIPSHLEQLDFLGTKAWVFNPKDPEDIARVIKEALDNPEKSKQMAKESKEAIDKYTWDNVAEGYYKVFKEAMEK